MGENTFYNIYRFTIRNNNLRSLAAEYCIVVISQDNILEAARKEKAKLNSDYLEFTKIEMLHEACTILE